VDSKKKNTAALCSIFHRYLNTDEANRAALVADFVKSFTALSIYDRKKVTKELNQQVEYMYHTKFPDYLDMLQRFYMQSDKKPVYEFKIQSGAQVVDKFPLQTAELFAARYMRNHGDYYDFYSHFLSLSCHETEEMMDTFQSIFQSLTAAEKMLAIIHLSAKAEALPNNVIPRALDLLHYAGTMIVNDEEVSRFPFQVAEIIARRFNALPEQEKSSHFAMMQREDMRKAAADMRRNKERVHTPGKQRPPLIKQRGTIFSKESFQDKRDEISQDHCAACVVKLA
jgi:hypothetical protein